MVKKHRSILKRLWMTPPPHTPIAITGKSNISKNMAVL